MSDLLALARRIGTDVAGVHAPAVDKDARFPHETLAALREERLLGALVPVELGGLGHDLRQAAVVVRELARHCASSAMILAMHHIQVAALLRAGDTAELDAFRRRVGPEQLLLASATTEMGIGGDTRRSSCHVEVTDGDGFALLKQAPVISYGEHADAILATARRAPDSPPADQVLVVCEKGSTTLTPVSGWDTLGYRGTCSLGFLLEAKGPIGLVGTTPYGEISTSSMLPVSHLLWSSLWLGLADEATARAQRFVRKAARKDLSKTPPGADRLARLVVTRMQMSGPVNALMERFLTSDEDPSASLDFMAEINALKVSSSTVVVDIVGQAMLICGIAGYREDTEYSLGRLLRDAHGAAVMVNNDRILGNTAQLAMAQRGL